MNYKNFMNEETFSGDIAKPVVTLANTGKRILPYDEYVKSKKKKKKKVDEALGTNKPRSGYAGHSKKDFDLITMRLAIHKKMMDDGIDSKKAFEIVKKMKPDELKKKYTEIKK